MQAQNENPYLSGNYAPVHDEFDVQDLKIIGKIPKELNGVYMRNGPNPAFPPISYTYPFDGDGMLHAVYIADGKANYKNRFVETRGLLKERKAGKTLYGGILHPIPIDPQWADASDEPIAIKDGAFIHVIHHAGQYLAMWETGPAYEINSQLQTLGEWKPKGMTQSINVCAHTRLDPLTGDLWCINYDITPPYLTIYRLDAKGVLIQKWDIEKSHSTMLHDFVLTKNYVIIFDCPIILDINKMMSGGSILNWQPELGVRIGVMPRTGGKMQWYNTDPFFVFHFANAYELDDNVMIDYIRHDKFRILTTENTNNKISPVLYRTTLNLKTGIVKNTPLDDRTVEFPRIREDRNSQQHQFIYTPTKTAANQNNRTMNALIKYDVDHNHSEIHDFGPHSEIGEAVFVPAISSKTEDDGYVMLFVYNNRENQSKFVILDSKNFSAKPLAQIIMPRRVPHGLHGSWIGF